MKARILSGIDRLDTVAEKLRGRRIGLMTNPTGVTHDLRSSIDVLHERFHLTALFAVEHGIRGDAQAGDPVETTVDPSTGVTVYSTYGANRAYTPEKLDAFDTLVYDMQDVGTRCYTYLYSLTNAMKACAEAGKPVVVLDRVNPLGGTVRQGIAIEPGCCSFVGNYGLPIRYGLTVGEYARYVKDFLGLKLDLTVATLSGWRRGLLLDETDLPWVAPSPNCYDLATALCYTGTCIFEGTNVSEGRGTTQPFQLIGAPFLNGEALEREMNALRLPGLHFRRVSFRPTFSKHAGELCHGVQMHLVDRSAANPFEGGLMLLDTVFRMAPEQAEFLCWNGAYALDKLLGTADYRAGRATARELIERGRADSAAFAEKARDYKLYEGGARA